MQYPGDNSLHCTCCRQYRCTLHHQFRNYTIIIPRGHFQVGRSCRNTLLHALFYLSRTLATRRSTTRTQNSGGPSPLLRSQWRLSHCPPVHSQGFRTTNTMPDHQCWPSRWTCIHVLHLRAVCREATTRNLTALPEWDAPECARTCSRAPVD
jgi:hypothetical protein